MCVYEIVFRDDIVNINVCRVSEAFALAAIRI